MTGTIKIQPTLSITVKGTQYKVRYFTKDTEGQIWATCHFTSELQGKAGNEWPVNVDQNGVVTAK